jgi:hypothetical protein
MFVINKQISLSSQGHFRAEYRHVFIYLLFGLIARDLFKVESSTPGVPHIRSCVHIGHLKTKSEPPSGIP